ncbi:MAG: hypothetical protein JXR73_15905 [Candidatus Omnitrophica bacterium]|nr:hypothetical protein [Candidatus Omnitrophota bacterium]
MNRSRILSIVIGAAAILWGGCDPKEGIRNFPHKPHIESELTCDFCHEMGEQTVGMPLLETCASCHDVEDKDVFGRCAECHEKHSVEWSEDSVVNHRKLFSGRLTGGWEDVRYNHAEHIDAEADCFACHAGVKTTERSSLDNLPSMKTAMAVQEEWGLSNDCQVCHIELNDFTPPSSHNNRWKESHGRLTEFSGKDSCLLCHQEETCMTCHQTEQPKSHNNLFRRKTHGIRAAFDRSKCLVCHRSDECMSCHQASAAPIPAAAFHTPDASCLTCHSPFASKGPQPRPRPDLFKPMPHRMMMGVTSQKCLTCHQF